MALQHVEAVMGTMVSIDIVDASEPTLIDMLVSWFHHVDAVFSPYKEDSTITQIGRGDMRINDASPEVQQVLTRCNELVGETRGIFDVWAIPAPNGTRFDPCGYVKGWSVQLAASLLEARGAHHFLLNAGGDIAVRGAHHESRPWRVGIRHPGGSDCLALTLQAHGNFGIATSGSYERGAHIFDPRTGQPSIDIASATVVGHNLADADAYATTLAVLGVDGLQWLAERVGYSGCVITADGLIHSTDEFDQYVLRS